MEPEKAMIPSSVIRSLTISPGMKGPAMGPIDEMYLANGGIRGHYSVFQDWLNACPSSEMERRRKEAERFFRRLGITFAVYGEPSGRERLIPFDVIPRILPANQWSRLASGLRQRVRALNAFLHDIYHGKEMVRAGLIPAEMVFFNPQYRVEMNGVDLPGHNYIHIAGIDIVHTQEDEFFVLEDNVRTPSGVSYMLANRRIMMRLFPELFMRLAVSPVERYPDLLLDTLCSVGPEGVGEPSVVLLTPGPYNSAYFEHSFLAREMGIDLVEARDLFIRDDLLYKHTTAGPVKVDVIYRRIDDDYLDPLAFRPESTLGIPGLMSVYRSGRVAVANAVGTGVADDKAVYVFVPEMIRFYLGEEPILKNVPTYRLRNPQERNYVLAHLNQLVVKEVHGSGGFGMLVGPASSSEQLASFKQRIMRNPEKYIAQPTLALSTCPTFVNEGIAPRHIDLRPFVLSGRTIHIVPGGLTRVALCEGSLVVNSSQGGGTKDTWVLEDEKFS